MTDKQRETALKKLQEGAHFHSSSDMNADMSTEAADMVVLAVDKYIPTQNWEVSVRSCGFEFSCCVVVVFVSVPRGGVVRPPVGPASGLCATLCASFCGPSRSRLSAISSRVPVPFQWRSLNYLPARMVKSSIEKQHFSLAQRLNLVL